MVEREEKIINAVQIRDTNDVFSNIADVRDLIEKVFFVENSLDADINVWVEVSRNEGFSVPMLHDPEATIVKQNENIVISLNDYYPFIRLKVQASGTPTTGDLTVYLHVRMR